MSEPARVGVVVEGPTDIVVLRAILPRILGREVVVTPLFPTDQSLAFSDAGATGFGWHGVLGWCDEKLRAGGIFALGVLTNQDFLVIHLDGDVARNPSIDLAQPCPPASATADALRTMLLSRLGLTTPHPKIVAAVPMDATESWLLALFRDPSRVDECQVDPAGQFIGGKPKLMNQKREKSRRRYEDALRDLAWDWRNALGLSQAARFDGDVKAAFP